jgi:Predicted Rossmann fold nucleotide-binding protein involved in DNA uptake
LEDLKYDIWLSSIKGIGPIKYYKLKEKYLLAKNIWELSKIELEEIELSDEIINSILDKENKNKMDDIIETLNNNQIKIISKENSNYPDILKNNINAPVFLYVKGNEKIFNNYGIAVVGSRECSDYGMKVAKYFSKELSERSLNIISGMARGIDSAAHNGCIESNRTNYSSDRQWV